MFWKTTTSRLTEKLNRVEEFVKTDFKETLKKFFDDNDDLKILLVYDFAVFNVYVFNDKILLPFVIKPKKKYFEVLLANDVYPLTPEMKNNFLKEDCKPIEKLMYPCDYSIDDLIKVINTKIKWQP